MEGFETYVEIRVGLGTIHVLRNHNLGFSEIVRCVLVWYSKVYDNCFITAQDTLNFTNHF